MPQDPFSVGIKTPPNLQNFRKGTKRWWKIRRRRRRRSCGGLLRKHFGAQGQTDLSAAQMLTDHQDRSSVSSCETPGGTGRGLSEQGPVSNGKIITAPSSFIKAFSLPSATVAWEWHTELKPHFNNQVHKESGDTTDTSSAQLYFFILLTLDHRWNLDFRKHHLQLKHWGFFFICCCCCFCGILKRI